MPTSGRKYQHIVMNIFKVVWMETKEELPKLYIGVYDDYRAFLEAVVAWLESRARKKGRETRLAREVIRDCQETFNGVGVYTANELFFDAGEYVWFPVFVSNADQRVFRATTFYLGGRVS